MNKINKIENVTINGASPLIVTNSLDTQLVGFGISGKTEQVQTTGAQLFDEKLLLDLDSPNYDKTTSASGIIWYKFPVESTVTISVKNNKNKEYLKVTAKSDKSNGVWLSHGTSSNSKIATLTPEDGNVYLGVNNNITQIKAMLEKTGGIMINTGSTAKPYEPHTGGKPSPSVEYPQDIINAGRYNEGTGKYEVDVKITGKNIVNIPDIDANTLGATIPCYITKNVSVNVREKATVSSDIWRFKAIHKDGTEKYIVDNRFPSMFYSTPENPIISITYRNTYITSGAYKGIMVEYGDNPTGYEPYKEQTLTVTSDRSITKWDKLVEQDGQIGWLYNSAEILLNGTENWIRHSEINKGTTQAFGLNISDLVYGEDAVIGQNQLADKFRYVNAVWTKDEAGQAANNGRLFINIEKTKASTVEEFKEWLKSNNVKVVYKTKQTEFVPLPKEEQEAIRALSTYYPTTVFTNNQDLNMTITYKKGITMANYEPTQLIVQMKALARTESLPVDSTEIWNSLAEAQAYTKAANAYGGQTIKAKLEDGKFHTYTIQPSEAGFVLEEIGANSDTKQYVIVVDELPQSKQEQGILYINKTDNTGYIWNGKGWQIVFKEISAEVDKLKDKVTAVEADVKTKAPINNPVFTGKVMVDKEEVALKSYVDGLISNLSNNAPGVVDKTHPLPANGYKAGQTWRVAEAGTYAGNKCEAGDLIICIKNYAQEGAGNADFMVVQANIDGAVTSTATTSTVGEIVVFDGSTGKVIKSSGINISSLNDAIAKAHEHANKTILDTYNKSQTDLLKTAKTEAQTLVDGLKKVVDGKADKATTLAGYGIEDAYNKTEIDGKLKTITDNVNTKVDATTVDGKIDTAKQEITEELTTVLETRIGDIPDSETVKAYVDRVAGSGSADVADQIATAKKEAIAESKAYTDSCLTVVEF